MNERAFDASRYLSTLKGKDYLEVKWRLLWLRTEHPDASIATELHTLTDSLAVFKATVRLPNGGEATGWGSETSQDFGDFIEKAETKALGRALAALGFGTQFTHDFDMENGNGLHVVDAPVVAPPTASNGKGNGRPAPQPTGELATANQVKAIYVIARNQHGLGEEETDERTRQQFGAVPAQLTKRQASQFIDALQGK